MSQSAFAEKLKQLYAEALLQDARFNFINAHGFLRGGVCPECGKKTVFFNLEAPWKVKCGRFKECRYSESTANLYPDVLERLKDEADKEIKTSKENTGFINRFFGGCCE